MVVSGAHLLLAAVVPFQEFTSIDDDDRPTAVVTRVDVAPVIDGRLDDEVWSRARSFDNLTQVLPVEGAEPSQRTVVSILYDRDYLYIGVRCYDSEPDRIVATQMERDAELNPDDRVEIVIDTFLDRRNAYFFQMSPVGSKGDALITDNGRDFNKPWDGIWEGRATIDDQGWSTEIALPFKTLNFRPGLSSWGFNINRYVKRHEEVLRWSGARRNLGIFRIATAGTLAGLEGMRQGVGLDVRPFFVANWENDRTAGNKSATGEPGFDLRYRLTPSLNFLLTVNTDFAEAEVDSRQINLTRFPLFFPERRDFFLQDAGQFEFGNLGRELIPFFSRRVGIDSSTGGEVPIEWGTKLTGRAGPWNIGALNVQTENAGAAEDPNLFVTRLARNVGGQSTIGGIVTHGNPTAAEDNALFGMDANFRTTEFMGDKNLTANVFGLATDTEDVSGDQHAYGASIAYPNDILRFDLAFLEIGENLNPALGFVPRTGVRHYSTGGSYRPRPGGAVRQYEFSVDGDLFTGTDGEVQTGQVELQPFGMELETGDSLRVEFETTKEVLTQDFVIRPEEGITIPTGSYSWQTARLELDSSDRRPMFFGGSFTHEGFFDGRRTAWRGELSWRPSRFLTTSVEYVQNEVSLPDGDFTTVLGRARANVSFSPDLSWSNFVQFDNDSDSVGINSRMRWIPKPGTELFLVFNESWERDDGVEPLAQQFTFKVEYTFRF
jgi:hypothetical protein